MSTATKAPPVADLSSLRASGRTPTVPFSVVLADGRTITLRRLLRVLPGRRIVGEADFEAQHVLAKLYLSGKRRHWDREQQGIEHLQEAGLPTPALIASAPLAGGGHVVATRFLEPSTTLLEAWQAVQHLAPGSAECIAVLVPAFHLLGRMHRQGVTHEDLHLGNFLRHRDDVLIIDGDTITRHTTQPLDIGSATRNLGLLVAQLPMAWDSALEPLLDAYASGNPGRRPSRTDLEAAIERARAARLADYMGKVRRNCSLFEVDSRFDRYSVVLRSAATGLAAVLESPDQALAEGRPIKNGATCTVGEITAGQHRLIVKRYNIKGTSHALSRLWRPSRAWHSWVEGHRLWLLGIPSPRPLAVVEERIGPLRRRAWLIMEYCEGIPLKRHLDPASAPPAAEGEAIRRTFAQLAKARISHGDLKASNLLWDGREIQLIDLDAMTQHRSQASHARVWRRDRARLLRNWPEDSPLHGWLNENLPPAN